MSKVLDEVQADLSFHGTVFELIHGHIREWAGALPCLGPADILRLV